MSDGKTILSQFLRVIAALLLVVFVLTGCGQVTDTSGLTGVWILKEADNGNVLVPDSLVEDNRLSLRLDPGGSGVIEGANTQGRVLWRYEDGIVYLRAASTALSGIVEGSELILQSEDETRLHFLREDQSRTKAK